MHRPGPTAVRACSVAVLVIGLGLSGCAAPAQTLHQGNELCAAGLRYADALDKLLDVTISGS